MTDPYLLLTPVLALAVLALARFVGCFIKPEFAGPLELPFVESFVLGTPRPDPSQAPFTGWAGMAILVGDKPITVTQLGRIMLTASTAAHDIKLVQRAGDTGGTDLRMVTLPIGTTSDSDSILGFAHATLQPAVELNPNTQYYIVSHEAPMGDVFYDFDTTVTPTTMTPTDPPVAQVLSGVFNDDTDSPDAGYQRKGGPGNTYGPVDFRYTEPE